MERTAEQVVAWHNRHPLAKRITIYDVHTMGVVALPFMRSGRAQAAAEPIEPMLTEEVSPESLLGQEGEQAVAANPHAAHLDALADQEAPPRPGPRELLARLLARAMFWRRAPDASRLWPAFSERFVPGLSPGRVAAFAQRHGWQSRPGDGTWPQRVIALDDERAAAGSKGGEQGGWPCELFVLSAAIDVGNSRTRVLIGRGRHPAIAGRRCLAPLRVGIAAAVLLAIAGTAAALWWPRSADGPAPAATPASAAAAAASAPVSAQLPASTPSPTAPAASEPMQAASAAAEAASALPAEASAPAEPVPDIRPRLVPEVRTNRPGFVAPPLHGASAAPAASAPAAASAAAADPASAPAAAVPSDRTPPRPGRAAPTDGPKLAIDRAIASGLKGETVVALVGPPSADKAAAEALLERMRAALAPMQPPGSPLQAQVFQTHEGWRAAVWPFASREEAQLLNATLVARGFRTKAVNF